MFSILKKVPNRFLKRLLIFFVPGERFEDYCLGFDEPFPVRLLEISPDGFLTGNYIPYLSTQRPNDSFEASVFQRAI